MGKFCLLLGVLFSGSVLAAIPPEPIKNFSYWVRVPARELGCQEEAQALAKQLATVSTVKNVEGKCRGQVTFKDQGKTYTLNSLVVTYSSEQEVHPYSAYLSSGLTGSEPSDESGLFETYQDCLNELSHFAIGFELEVKLPIAAAYCKPGKFGGNFVMGVDTFGVPKKKLFVHRPTRSRGQFEDKVPELLNRMGAVIAYAAGGSVFYFHEDKLSVRFQHFGFFAEPVECTEQLDEAHAIFQASGSLYVYTACTAGAVGGSQLKGLADGEVMLTTSFSSFSESYYSFTECKQDKARLMQDALAKGYHPLGVICRKGELQAGRYIADLYQPL